MNKHDQPLVTSLLSFKDHFYDLIDSLSTLQDLSALQPRPQAERELLIRALGTLVRNQNLERCSILLLEEGRLVNAASTSWPEQVAGATAEARADQATPASFALGEGIAGIAVQTGVLQHCKDCRQDPRFIKKQDATGSLICVPIRCGDDTIGVLNVSHPQPYFFDHGTERLLIIFADILGQLIAHNRLILTMEQRIQQKTLALEAALKEAEDLRQHYERISLVDDLTGLYNRRFFLREADGALAQATRHRQPIALMLADVDRFKTINDRHGHHTGDEALVLIANSLNETLRNGDILARMGGEEFAILLPHTDCSGAEQLAERLRDAVGALPWQEQFGFDGATTLSVGIAQRDGDTVASAGSTGNLLANLMREADTALYYCKHHGRNRIARYDQLPEQDRA